VSGTVTRLEIQKRNKERVNVYLDDRFAFGLALNLALELKKGQHLSDADIARLKADDDRRRAYERALHFLGFRARSRAEMERYLRGKEYSAGVIAATVQRLAAEGLLNDAEFAQAWTDNRQQLKPKSKRALRYELRQKGVDGESIEQALADLDEDDAARRALAPKLRQWRHLPEADFKKKALAFLARRGFNYDVARPAVEDGWAGVAEDSEE